MSDDGSEVLYVTNAGSDKGKDMSFWMVCSSHSPSRFLVSILLTIYVLPFFSNGNNQCNITVYSIKKLLGVVDNS